MKTVDIITFVLSLVLLLTGIVYQNVWLIVAFFFLVAGPLVLTLLSIRRTNHD